MRPAYARAAGICGSSWCELGTSSRIIDETKTFMVMRMRTAHDAETGLVTLIADHLREHETSKVQVVCLSRPAVRAIAAALRLAFPLRTVFEVVGGDASASQMRSVAQWMQPGVNNSIMTSTTVLSTGISNLFCDLIINYGGAYSLMNLVQCAGRVGRGNRARADRPVAKHVLLFCDELFYRVFGRSNEQRRRGIDSNAVAIFSSDDTFHSDRNLARLTLGPGSVEKYVANIQCTKKYLVRVFDNRVCTCIDCKICNLSVLACPPAPYNNDSVNPNDAEFLSLQDAELHGDELGGGVHEEHLLTEDSLPESSFLLAKVARLLQLVARYCPFCKDTNCNGLQCKMRRRILGKHPWYDLCFHCDGLGTEHKRNAAGKPDWCRPIYFKNLQLCVDCLVPLNWLQPVYQKMRPSEVFSTHTTGPNMHRWNISQHRDHCLCKERTARNRLRGVVFWARHAVLGQRSASADNMAFWSGVSNNENADMLDLTFLSSAHESLVSLRLDVLTMAIDVPAIRTLPGLCH